MKEIIEDNTNLTATGGHGSVVAWAIATPDGSELWQYVRVSLVGCHGPLRSARYRMQETSRLMVRHIILLPSRRLLCQFRTQFTQLLYFIYLQLERLPLRLRPP